MRVAGSTDTGSQFASHFGARFWEGFAVGVANAALVAAGMMAFGGMTVHGLALHGTTILWATLAWPGSNMLVGVAEEYLFRGYLLQTLWKLRFLAGSSPDRPVVWRRSLLL
jgi:membrane protease YdiL (CAAX protease family)